MTEINARHGAHTEPQNATDDLGYAVNRWEYEGGADVDGPQEGFATVASTSRPSKPESPH